MDKNDSVIISICSILSMNWQWMTPGEKHDCMNWLSKLSQYGLMYPEKMPQYFKDEIERSFNG